MGKMDKIDDLELGAVSGGTGGPGEPGWKWVMANVQNGYLALRSFPAYDPRNEIAKIVTGTKFQAMPDKKMGDYVYASYNGDKGWINSKYVSGLEM